MIANWGIIQKLKCLSLNIECFNYKLILLNNCSALLFALTRKESKKLSLNAAFFNFC